MNHSLLNTGYLYFPLIFLFFLLLLLLSGKSLGLTKVLSPLVISVSYMGSGQPSSGLSFPTTWVQGPVLLTLHPEALMRSSPCVRAAGPAVSCV